MTNGRSCVYLVHPNGGDQRGGSQEMDGRGPLAVTPRARNARGNGEGEGLEQMTDEKEEERGERAQEGQIRPAAKQTQVESTALRLASSRWDPIMIDVQKTQQSTPLCRGRRDVGRVGKASR
jgi:hypothetical protein